MDELTLRLRDEFARLNIERFGGLIQEHSVRFSRRSFRTHGSINFRRKQIRVSLQLYEQHGWEAVVQTLLHEMTHALLHQEGRRDRHTKLFWAEFKSRGGVRDKLEVKPVGGFVYACPTCGLEMHRLRKIRHPWRYSCRSCDRRYNPRHRLYLTEER
ncbi:MAG: SprT-like domain-containing protein [Candidatus Altiarchaeota archaeon]